MSYCARCGAAVSLGASFCAGCGAPIGKAVQPAQSYTPSPQAIATPLKYEIKYRPSYALLVISLATNQSVTAEAGALTYMTPNITINTHKRKQSLLGTLGMTLLGGQSFFVNTYTAVGSSGEAAFVSAPLGDIERLEVRPDKGYVIQKAAYVASSPDVNLDIEWQGFKGIFGQGLFMVKVTGQGDLFINTFGALDRHELAPGQSLIVDNFHLVAFSDTCQYRVTKLGGLKTTLLGGEGLVTEITGPGELFIQTKNIYEFTEWLWTLLEPRIQARAR